LDGIRRLLLCDDRFEAFPELRIGCHGKGPGRIFAAGGLFVRRRRELGKIRQANGQGRLGRGDHHCRWRG
jgi:hypothetical protein